MKRPPLVEVEWLDAMTHTDAMALSDVEARAVLTRRITSGYLIEQYKDGRTVIAHTYDHAEKTDVEDFVADVTVIPTDWVQGIKYTKGKPPKKRRK